MALNGSVRFKLRARSAHSRELIDMKPLGGEINVDIRERARIEPVERASKGRFVEGDRCGVQPAARPRSQAEANGRVLGDAAAQPLPRSAEARLPCILLPFCLCLFEETKIKVVNDHCLYYVRSS